MEETLLCISPIDGRYRDITKEIREVFNEYSLIKNRVIVEIEWFSKLSKELNLSVSDSEIDKIKNIKYIFNIDEAKRVKEIEQTTKHDVKAVEYYLREKFEELGVSRFNNFIHFGCTSEDINNLSYGIMMKELLNCYIKKLDEVLDILKEKSHDYSNISMLSHTHGQSATPTTVGKEFANFYYRINRLLNKLKQEKMTGKFNGAVGNYNSFVTAYPNVEWQRISKEFVNSFDLEFNEYTTQIEPHDELCLILSIIKLINNVLQDFDSDMWLYISRGYFAQKNVEGEIGSSVMPHKINPINFENSMANIRMSNGIIDVFTSNIQVSRMQRDLSDSSLLRNIGSIFAHSIISISQTMVGINKTSVNIELLQNELKENPEVLAEAIQTTLRKNNIENAYEKLKELTKGKKVSLEELHTFISNLEINEDDKEMLLGLTPEKYTGLAEKLAKQL